MICLYDVMDLMQDVRSDLAGMEHANYDLNDLIAQYPSYRAGDQSPEWFDRYLSWNSTNGNPTVDGSLMHGVMQMLFLNIDDIIGLEDQREVVSVSLEPNEATLVVTFA